MQEHQIQNSPTSLFLASLAHPAPGAEQMTYHLPDVGEEPVSKVLSGFDGELSGKVVDGAHEDPVPLHTAGTTGKVMHPCC